MDEFVRDSTDPVTLLIARLSEVSSSIEEAIAAIATNSLAEFENSLWLQEMAVPSLNHSIQMMHSVTIPADRKVILRDAVSRLRMLNTTYEYVIKQGFDTAAVLHRMHIFYCGLAGAQSASGSMSCEV